MLEPLPPIKAPKLAKRLKGEALPPAGATLGKLLEEINLKDKVEAANAWGEKVGAAGVADLQGEYVDAFIAALDP